MTEQEQRLEIAEAVGWHQMRDESGYWNVDPNGKLHPSEVGGCHGIPDYLNDLNAMHEAEKVLDENIKDASSKRYLYAHLLYSVVGVTEQPCRATARQRAEAFLRTIGKWKE